MHKPIIPARIVVFKNVNSSFTRKFKANECLLKLFMVNINLTFALTIFVNL